MILFIFGLVILLVPRHKQNVMNPRFKVMISVGLLGAYPAASAAANIFDKVIAVLQLFKKDLS